MSLFTFLMPDIGEGVVEGEVVSWLKKEGDFLKKDEPVLVLMTDKATVEIPTPHPGKLSKVYYKAGEIAKKGLPLFDVEIGNKPLASPAVRKQARDQGIPLEEMKGSGPEGHILKEDLTGIRRLMAKRMAASHAEIPAFSYFEPANADQLVQFKTKELTFMPFFIKALSLTLKTNPLANSSLSDNALIQHPHHHIGIAMKTPLGLIVPVLKNVETMNLMEVAQNYQMLKDKALKGQLAPSDMKEATITITNFGALSQGARYATPIINPPEVAILGLAYIRKEPIVKDNALAIAEILHCSWSFDHRIIDGEAAAAISSTFVNLIENPALIN